MVNENKVVEIVEQQVCDIESVEQQSTDKELVNNLEQKFKNKKRKSFL